MSDRSRLLTIVALIVASVHAPLASAQSQPRNLEPLPDIPPPPRLSSRDLSSVWSA